MGTEIRTPSGSVRTAVLSGFGVLAIVVLGYSLTWASSWSAAEMNALRQVNLSHTGALDQVALGLNWLFGAAIAAILLVLGTITVLLITRRARTACQFMVVVATSWLGNDILKVVVHRPRPDVSSLANALVLHPSGFSFPSGHTSFAACFLLGFIVIARGPLWRPLLVVVAAVLSLATGWSRVYLGVHYPSDVVGSILYSIASVIFINSVWSMIVVTDWKVRRRGLEAVEVDRGASHGR